MSSETIDKDWDNLDKYSMFIENGINIFSNYYGHIDQHLKNSSIDAQTASRIPSLRKLPIALTESLKKCSKIREIIQKRHQIIRRKSKYDAGYFQEKTGYASDKSNELSFPVAEKIYLFLRISVYYLHQNKSKYKNYNPSFNNLIENLNNIIWDAGQIFQDFLLIHYNLREGNDTKLGKRFGCQENYQRWLNKIGEFKFQDCFQFLEKEDEADLFEPKGQTVHPASEATIEVGAVNHVKDQPSPIQPPRTMPTAPVITPIAGKGETNAKAVKQTWEEFVGELLQTYKDTSLSSELAASYSLKTIEVGNSARRNMGEMVLPEYVEHPQGLYWAVQHQGTNDFALLPRKNLVISDIALKIGVMENFFVFQGFTAGNNYRDFDVIKPARVKITETAPGKMDMQLVEPAKKGIIQIKGNPV